MNALREPLAHAIVAVDLSPAARTVLDRAGRLPFRLGAELVVFHVVPEASLGSFYEREPAVARARQALADDVARLQEQLAATVTVVARVVVGTPADEILRCARDERTELVVIGRQGHRSWSEVLLGSTVERVLRHSEAPVLVVHPESSRACRRVLVAADLANTTQRATAMALRLLDRRGTEMRVIHADDGRAREVTTEILRFLEPFRDLDVRWDVVDRRGEPRTVVIEDAAAWKPDLLVLGTHGHSTVAQQVLGSVAEASVRAARCDVLLARPTR
jgi:nucleotide-binding universal stress UspA family protein